MRASIRKEIEQRSKLPPAKPKRGRPPRTDIDRDRIVSLAASGCSVREIAATVGCAMQTLYDRFADDMQTGRERGRGMIKRTAFELAVVKKDGAMIRYLLDKIISRDEKRPEAQVNIQTTMGELEQMSTKEIEVRLAKLRAIPEGLDDEILQ